MSIGDALNLLAAEEVVWARIAAVREDDSSQHARLVELTSGAPPPNWEGTEWDYPAATFLGVLDSGPTLVAWLQSEGVVLGGHAVKVPELAPSVSWERRQSCATGIYEPLPWASAEVILSQSGVTHADPQGHLISARGAPSFVNFYAAAAYFFWREQYPTGGSLQQGIVYRHQDTRGRINSVRIDDDEVEVCLEGEGLDGMVIELAGDAPGRTEQLHDRDVSREAVVRFSLTNGLPPGAWVLLRTELEWIDRRFLAIPWTRGPEAGVEIVVDPHTKLEAFLANREGPRVEFKRQVPTEDDSKAQTMKTVCAFANGDGGSILFGIDDDHELVGVPAAIVDRSKDQVTQMVGAWVEPRPDISFEMLPLDENSVVLELIVMPGVGLHGCAQPGRVAAPYIRVNAISVKARPHEIERIVRERTSVVGRLPWQGG